MSPPQPDQWQRAHARRQEARDALQQALAAVWSGADFLDTDAVTDHLGDLGYEVNRKGAR